MYFTYRDFPNLEIYFETVLNVYYFECPGGRDKKRYVTTTYLHFCRNGGHQSCRINKVTSRG